METTNGLVLMLPHGYEGQGAEHSSQEWKDIFNIKIICTVNCTTPSNLFHILRQLSL